VGDVIKSNMNPKLETIIQIAKIVFGIYFIYIGFRILEVINLLTK